ncbi:MAG TPA: TIGR04283 family arsenosugar biosynthesis glycosyltransferase [Cyanobium sp.]|nr:TIGR04283 family arsenosugar biosynthesis glycosyltransferase [Cyanobium sp.]
MATPKGGEPATVTVSVIIPLLNEAAAVAAFSGHWQELRARGAELLLVDGGSEDGTVPLIERAGFTVIRSARGRARQMNAGAARASGGILIFLHADTRLPEGALEMVRRSLRPPRCWGRFDVEIVGRQPMLAVVARCMNLRSRWSGIATGDQAIFLHRRVFDRVGGFPDQPLMEDVELSARLRSLAPPVCLKATVATSGRRWQAGGIGRTILLMWSLRFAYWLGVPAPALARLYGG